jgi:uncharacterized CHY-type Zn-finger protein
VDVQAETVIFNGIKFRRYPDSERHSDRDYYRPDGRRIRQGMGYLHQEVWKFHNGDIPDGYHVHHRDGNSLNNDITNLECLPEFDHLSMHGKENEHDLEHLAAIRPLAAAWHGTEEGRKSGKFAGRRAWSLLQPHAYVCQHCGKVFERKSINPVKFCSNACKSAWRRTQHIDDEQRVCVVCGATFTVNRYSKAKTCSGLCSARSRFMSGGDRASLQPACR